MSPVNLRVPTDLSKNLDKLKEKMFIRNRDESQRTSISLKIPNKSAANLTEVVTEMQTPTHSPSKTSVFKKSPKKKSSLASSRKVRLTKSRTMPLAIEPTSFSGKLLISKIIQ